MRQLHGADPEGPVNRRLTLFDRGTGDVGFTLVARPADARPARMYEVDVVSLDALAARFGVDEIAFLKMDVEGAEHALLARSEEWLDRVEVLMIELHERIVAGCETAFAEATGDRVNRRFGGEKHVSFRQSRRALAIAAE